MTTHTTTSITSSITARAAALVRARRLTAWTGVTALTVGLLLAPGAAAATTTPEPDPGIGQDRLERVCLRLPLIEDRLLGIQERLNGDTDTVGSLLWTEAAIEQAEAAGREGRAQALANRLEVRTAFAGTIESRLSLLADAQDRCDARTATSE